MKRTGFPYRIPFFPAMLLGSCLFLLTGLLAPTWSQQDSIPASADCQDAKEIKIIRDYYSPQPPNGGGVVDEFKDEDKFSQLYFENEHNTAWYTFRLPRTGTLTFDIIPDSLKDDYDFLIYRYDGPDFCQHLMDKTLQPMRTNIGRNDPKIQSMTGLAHTGVDSFKQRGPGPSYSQPVRGKRGDRFYLVLDNVYEDGGNHLIRFNMQLDTVFNGLIVDDLEGKPVPTVVFLQDAKTGEIVGKTTNDPVTGLYTLPVIMEYGHDYHLVLESPGHFFKEIEVEPERIKKYDLNNLDIRMPRLRPGRSFDMHSILFVGNQDVVLEESEPSLERLHRLLDKNPGLEVEIVGHTNGVGTISTTFWHKELSTKRANKIANYLTEAGVVMSRLTTEGYGCDRMLYPRASNEYQLKKNRRVEIVVKKYELIVE